MPPTSSSSTASTSPPATQQPPAASQGLFQRMLQQQQLQRSPFSYNAYSPSSQQLSLEGLDRFFVVHAACTHRDSPLSAATEPLRGAILRLLDEYRVAATALPRDDKVTAATREAVLEAMKDVPGLVKYHQRLEDLDRRRDQELGPGPKHAFDALAMTNMSKIMPGIFVSGYHPACDAKLLQQHGITHVLCCIDMKPKFPAQFIYMGLPADDTPDYDISQHFAATFEFIERALTQGGGVLIHCGAGVSRAPTIAAAYMIRRLAIPYEQALARLLAARAGVKPNKGFEASLVAFASSVLEQRFEQEEAARRAAISGNGDDAESPVMPGAAAAAFPT